MPTIASICTELELLAPLALAEEWDNVGLLVGDRTADVDALMTCLTVTPSSVDEAINKQARLIVTHHPMPFRPLKKITADTTVGRLLLKCIEAGIGIYSAHTAFDSAAAGINQQLTAHLQLEHVAPLKPLETDSAGLGAGRIGRTSGTLAECAGRLKTALGLKTVRFVGAEDQNVTKVATACGSGGAFLAEAAHQGADLMVTGEAQFHTCLEAEALGVGLVLLGHFASERFAVERLANQLQEKFPDVRCWASQEECDPIQVV